MQKLAEPYQSLFEAMLWDCGAEAVSELIRKGADLSYCDPNTGRTVLFAATIANRSRTVAALLQNGADPNQRFTYRSPVDGRVEANRVAIHYAHSAEVADALIKAGADLNTGDINGITPLMFAAFHGHAPVVMVLLSAGACPLIRQIKKRGRKSRTARELAESKVEFWRDAMTINDQQTSESRMLCYQKVCEILAKAEVGAQGVIT